MNTHHVDLTAEQLRILRLMIRWDLIGFEFQLLEDERHHRRLNNKEFTQQLIQIFDAIRHFEDPLVEASKDKAASVWSFEMSDKAFGYFRDLVHKDFASIKNMFADTASEEALFEEAVAHQEALRLAFTDRPEQSTAEVPFRFSMPVPQFKQ